MSLDHFAPAHPPATVSVPLNTVIEGICLGDGKDGSTMTSLVDGWRQRTSRGGVFRPEFRPPASHSQLWYDAHPTPFGVSGCVLFFQVSCESLLCSRYTGEVSLTSSVTPPVMYMVSWHTVIVGSDTVAGAAGSMLEAKLTVVSIVEDHFWRSAVSAVDREVLGQSSVFPPTRCRAPEWYTTPGKYCSHGDAVDTVQPATSILPT